MFRQLLKVSLVILVMAPAMLYADNPFRMGQMNHEKVEGRMILIFDTPKKDVHQDIETILKHDGEFKNIIKGLNSEFMFPEDVTVRFSENDGPSYSPKENEILMSYNFIFYLATIYFESYPKASDEDMLTFAKDATVFLFYHELAHAFIDIYNLPIVSNEETAADNLAVILALEYTDDGLNVVLDTAELFDLLDQKIKHFQEDDYWDEHALDAQRFYNILCLAYGKYPKKVKKIVHDVKNEKLTQFLEERGDYCIDQYDQQLYAWGILLKPFFKQ